MSTENKAQSIEEKQYLIRFNADTQSHLHVLDADICLTKCPDKICTIFCPAEVYKWEEIRMHVGYEGCHECGSCRIGCPHQNIKWEYPKGGMGLSLDWDKVIFKIGDRVVFKLDGARGIVLAINQNKCHVAWEDTFVSWEKVELLQYDMD